MKKYPLEYVLLEHYLLDSGLIKNSNTQCLIGHDLQK